MAQGGPAVLEGQLMAYILDPADSPRRAADALDRVLKGERAGNIPIVRPTGYAFVINLKAADAIGFKFPESVLSQATEVLR
jgi:putative ABC transport system substrate-binding protein